LLNGLKYKSPDESLLFEISLLLSGTIISYVYSYSLLTSMIGILLLSDESRIILCTPILVPFSVLNLA